MSSWASNKEDKMLFESWRSYLLKEITPEQDAEARRAANAEVDAIAPDQGEAPQANKESQQKMPISQVVNAFHNEKMLAAKQARYLFRLIGRVMIKAEANEEGEAYLDLSEIDCNPKLGPIKYDYRDKVRDLLQKMFTDANWKIKVEYTKPPCNASPQQQGPEEGEPGGEAEETPGDDQPADDNAAASLPIPVSKKWTGKERAAAGLNKSAAGSLASQLAKLFPDVDKSIITQILKDIAGQMKTNGLNIQEGKQLVLKRLVEEHVVQAILAEATSEETTTGTLGTEPGKDNIDALEDWYTKENVGTFKEQAEAFVEMAPEYDASSITSGELQNDFQDVDPKDILSEGEKDEWIRKRKNILLQAKNNKFNTAAALLLGEAEKWTKEIKKAWDKLIDPVNKQDKSVIGKPEADRPTISFLSEQLKIWLEVYGLAGQLLEKYEEQNKESETPDEDEVEEEPTPEEEPKEKLRFDVVPDLFVQMWNRVTGTDNKKAGGISAKDAWERLPSGKVGRKVQTIREVEGTATGVGSAAGRSTEKFGKQFRYDKDTQATEDVELTKVGWFKVQQDAPRRTSDKDLMTHNFDPIGSGEQDIRSGLRAFVGALMNKMRQYAKGGAGETTRRQGKSGTINAKAVVGTRLKQGGIDLKNPKGAALQQKMQKVIHDFIKKNLKRVGKTEKDITVIAENAELRRQLVEVYLAHVKNQRIIH